MKIHICIFSLVFIISSFKTTYSQVSRESIKINTPVTLIKFFDKILSSYDTSYIKREAYDFNLGVNSHNWMDSYTLHLEDEELQLQSKLSRNMGIQFGYHFLQLGYSVNLNRLLSGKEIKIRELDLSMLINPISMEIFYYKNQGQTQLAVYSSPDTIVNLGQSYNRLNAGAIELDINYFFNHKQYSHPSAYAFYSNFVQIKSAGSFILGFSLSNHNNYYDFSDFKNQELLASLYNLSTLSNKYSMYCINAGYGYNKIIHTHWLFNWAFTSSVGVKKERYIQIKTPTITLL